VVHQRYGDISYATVEVQFGDGRSELFWHHERKEFNSSNSDPGESRDSLWAGRRVECKWCEEPSLTTSHAPLHARPPGNVEKAQETRMHRGLPLADTSHRNKYRAGRLEQARRCGHRLLSVVPLVSIRVEGGYRGRCLLCGTNGPIRGNAEAARGGLFNRVPGNEQ
jgi:hypothetical protein